MNRSKGLFVLAMLIFGSIGLFVRRIELSSAQIALIRGLVGSTFLLIASHVMKQKLSWKALRPNVILLLASGAAIGFNWIFLFEAYRYTTISNATLSYYLAPVFVIFLSPFILKEKLTAIKLVCIIGAVIGMFFVVGIGDGPGKNHLMGIGYGLLAAVLYSSVILLNKFLKGLSGLETSVIQLSTASLILLPYVLITDQIQLTKIDSKSLFFLLIVGIIHTGIAYLLYFTAMQKLSGQTIAVFSYIDPISAIIMSSIILGEQMTIIQLFGGLMILGSTFINDIFEKKKGIEE